MKYKFYMVYWKHWFIGIIETNYNFCQPYWTERGCKLVGSNDYNEPGRVEMSQYLAKRG